MTNNLTNSPTKDLMNDYFNNIDETKANKIRGQVDRPELYEYEKEINKQFLEFDINEFIGLLVYINKIKRENNNKQIGSSSLESMISTYSSIYNYNVFGNGLIYNPIIISGLKSQEIINQVVLKNERFNKKKFYDVIEKLHLVFEENRAKFSECLLLAFYNGIITPGELMQIKEENIDFEKKTINLPKRKIKMSDRFSELLTFVHNLEDMEGGGNEVCLMVSWNNSYFKYSKRRSSIKNFDDKSLKSVEDDLRSKINIINKSCKATLNNKIIYMLGFYDKLCDEYGKETLDEAIKSKQHLDITKEIMVKAKEYGIEENISRIRKTFFEFM